MKKYEAYKDSGAEWMGEIPESWNCCKIKWITAVKRGASPRPIDDPQYFDETGEFAWVRIADVTASERYLEQTTEKLSVLGSSLSVKRYPGDFFLSIAGSVGKPMITKIKCCIHDGFVWFPDLKIDPEYLYYIFQTGLPYLGLGKLGTQLNLNTDSVGGIEIPIPSGNEIDLIVPYLDHKTNQLDRLIAKKEKLIELLQEERTAIINHAVTKGLDPNVPLKDSGIEWLGEIPKHWGVKKLKYVGQCQNGVSAGAEYFGSGFPFVSYGDVYKNTELPLSVSGLAKSTDADRENFSVMEGDIFFTRTSETIEEIGLASTCMMTIENAIFAGFLIRFRPFKGMLEKEFSKYYFRCQIQRLFFVKEMNLVTRASLSQELLKRLPVLLPSLEEQKRISDFLDRTMNKIDTTIFKTQQELELLKEYKTALISEVVTGKVDVRNEPLT